MTHSSILTHIRGRCSAFLAVQRMNVLSSHQQQQQQQQQVSVRMLTTIRPIFRKANNDGSEEEIEEVDLYRYTRYRWLCSEPEKVAIRQRKFNIQELLHASVEAVGNGAKSCVKVIKCIEGQFNKAFLLTMDNGIEAFAKLPNPNAGPAYFTTASEVATRHFLREVLGLPVPHIYASSSDSSNTVGAEYIIEEKACGKPLGSLWRQWSRESRLGMVSQIVEFERKLASVFFLRHGCIYYKADLEHRGLPAKCLMTELLTTESLTTKFDPSILHKFTLGPLTEARLWENERAKMNLDRGPWSSTLEYVKALGTNEIKWVESYAKPRMNFHRSMESPESPGDFLSLLRRYMTLAPYLLPKNWKATGSRTLSHPDLHLDNIFVDPNTKEITNIVDWQSASISEMFLQRGVPPMLPHPELGSSNSTLEEILGCQDSNKDGQQHTDILAHYERQTKISNPRRWAALKEKNISILTKPVSLICGAWNREDVFSFRHALITVVAHWKDIAPNSISCPIHFTDLELELHGKEMELLEGIGTIMHQLQAENIIPLGGMVRPEDYERAQEANKRFREVFISLAESEHQRALHSRVWPYQDT